MYIHFIYTDYMMTWASLTSGSIAAGEDEFKFEITDGTFTLTQAWSELTLPLPSPLILKSGPNMACLHEKVDSSWLIMLSGMQ